MNNEIDQKAKAEASGAYLNGFGCSAMIISVAIAYAIILWAWQGFPGLVPK